MIASLQLRILTLADNQQVSVACEGTGNVLLSTNVQFNSASCVPGTSTLKVGTLTLAFSSLGCKAAVKETIKATGTCSTTGTQIEIGWQQASSFINQITICHNKSNANTLYSIDKIYGANIDADDQTNTRPSFRKGSYFVGIDVDTAYSQSGQNVTVANLVGSSSLAVQYIDLSKSYYFARGHLSPDGDFIDAASQDATYYYINAAPQWQSFNNGNWKSLELATRSLASTRKLDLVTYTGTFGTMTLADVNGLQQPIYLAKDSNNNYVIPVPKYYWKVIHDPVSNTATAVVGINNPHLGMVTGADVLCDDVCSQITWAPLSNRLDITKGYTFCCTVQSLRNAIPHAPNLGNLPLLV